MLLVINVRRRDIFYSVCRANKNAAVVETPSPTLATIGLLDISEENGKDIQP